MLKYKLKFFHFFLFFLIFVLHQYLYLDFFPNENNKLGHDFEYFLPNFILLLGFIHVIITPLREVFKIEPLLMIPYYLTGVLIGIFIYRKSNTVKDYEYRRSKIMKKMKKTSLPFIMNLDIF